MSTETSPDWLPTGWTEHSKFLKSGRKITHYLNVTGQLFFTKDQLIRYTKTCSTECNDVQPTLRQTKAPSTNGYNSTAVNACEHPEWLPKNWFMELKTKMSGANIQKCKIYVDPSTGYRFYSKAEVLWFLNRVEQKGSSSAQKTRPLRSTCKTTLTAYERPEWLPNNWFIELKSHMSGKKKGRHFKIYFDPSTGSRLYSKPQVLRFLNRVEKKSSSSAQKIAVPANEYPEWLPNNWLMELKPRMSGKKEGRQYKIYVEPLTGFRFYSKPAVLRFLTRMKQKRCKSKQKNRGSSSKCKAGFEKVVIEKSTVGDLPAGWIKEVKIRRNIKGVIRVAYYIDPARGYVFRSKKDVLRYLETGEISKYAFLPKKKHINDQKASDSEKSLPAAKRQKVKHPATRPQLIRADVLQLKKLHESGTEKTNNIKTENSSKSKNKKELNFPHRFSTQLALPEPELVDKATQLLNFRSNAGEVKKSSIVSTVKSCGNLMKKIIKSAEGEDIQGKQPQVLKTEKTNDAMSEIQPLVCSDACLESSNTAASSVPQEKNLGKIRMRSKSSCVKTKNSSLSKKMEELNLPRRTTKRLAQYAPELVANGVSKEVTNQNVTTCYGKNDPKSPCVLALKAAWNLSNCPNPEHPYQASVSTVSIKPHGDKALLEHLPQMLGTHKDGHSKSELQPLFCSDPCLEFAIKTLTGAIPLEDAITEELVSTPISNIQQKSLAKSRIRNSNSRKGLFNSTRSKKKDRHLPCALEQLAGHEQEMVENSLSNEGVANIAVRKSCKSKGIQNANLTSENTTEKAYQQLKIDPIMPVEHHDCTYKTNIFHVGSSNKGKEPHKNQTVPTDMKNEKPRLQSTISFGYPRSGPAESTISFGSYFQQQFGSFGTQRSGDGPKSEISSKLDAMAQPVVQQHFPVNTSFLLPDNKSLPSFSDWSQQSNVFRSNLHLHGC